MSATLLYRIQGVRVYRYKKTNYQKDCVRIHFSVPKDRCVCPECGNNFVWIKEWRTREFVGVFWDTVRDIEQHYLEKHFSNPSFKGVRSIVIDAISSKTLIRQKKSRNGFKEHLKRTRIYRRFIT